MSTLPDSPPPARNLARLVLPAAGLVVAVATASLAPRGARAAERAGWSPLPAGAWTEPARPDSGGRDAIILLDEGAAQDKGSSYRYVLSRRIRIFTEAGRDAGKIEIDYLKGRTKLVDLQARSVRRDGAVTEMTPDQVVTTTIVKAGGEEYSRATLIVPGIEPGCIVEYRYAIEGKYDGFWALPWSFQNGYYTVESSFRWRTYDLTAMRPAGPPATWPRRTSAGRARPTATIRRR